MDDRSTPAFLYALQIADGTLPLGRFAHSYGLEAWLEANPEAGAEAILELVRSTLAGSIATLDGAGVALAHRAASQDDLVQLRAIDSALTARKLNDASRRASTLCGRRLATLVRELEIGGVAGRLARETSRGAWASNLAVVEGALGASMGIAREHSALIAARGHASAMLSSAVRLGRLGATRSQALIYALTPDLEQCARVALGTSLNDMQSTLPELEIHAARHDHREGRLFMS